jgi:DNA-binding CsgD family transcriptional regulator
MGHDDVGVGRSRQNLGVGPADACLELVVARGPRGEKARRTAVLQAAYALTSAEVQITEYLVERKSAEIIAAKRGVSVATVRTQVKTIMAKLGVSRQVELVVRLGEL